MPLVTLRQLLDEAAKGGYGVGAFNVNNMEQIQAIMEAARETKSPVIVQASRGARAYSNDNFLYHLMLAAAELYRSRPLLRKASDRHATRTGRHVPCHGKYRAASASSNTQNTAPSYV